MRFKIGQEVVCVVDYDVWTVTAKTPVFPVIGRVYTIKSICVTPIGTIGCTLEELPNAFDTRGFRPINTISVYESELSTIKMPETV